MSLVLGTTQPLVISPEFLESCKRSHCVENTHPEFMDEVREKILNNPKLLSCTEISLSLDTDNEFTLFLYVRDLNEFFCRKGLITDGLSQLNCEYTRWTMIGIQNGWRMSLNFSLPNNKVTHLYFGE